MIVCLDLYEVALTQWEFPIGTCALVVLSIQIFVPIGIRQYRTRLPTVRRFQLPGNSPGYQLLSTQKGRPRINDFDRVFNIVEKQA